MNTNARAAALGKLLREARDLRDLTAQQLAADTGIPIGHVEAFEAGQLEAIPGGLYRRAEVRAYADAVGLDATHVLTVLHGAIDQDGEPEARSTSPVGEAESEDPLVAALIGPCEPPLSRHASAARAPDLRTWRMAAVLVIGGGALLWEQPGAAPTVPRPPLMTAAMPVEAADDVHPTPSAAVEVVEEEAVEEAGHTIAARPAPPPSAPRGRARPQPVLIVNTTPTGARVTVNGIGWGTTPVSIRHLPAGPKRIRVVKDRFRAEERVVDVSPNHPRRVSIDLRRVR